MRRLDPSAFGAVTRLLAANDLIATDLDPADMSSFVGVLDGPRLVAVGCLQASGPAGLLRSLASDPGARGRGHASAIVRRLESDASASGVTHVYLLTETAATFFERLGYRSVLRSKAPSSIAAAEQFTTLCPDTASFMRKRLT